MSMLLIPTLVFSVVGCAATPAPSAPLSIVVSTEDRLPAPSAPNATKATPPGKKHHFGKGGDRDGDGIADSVDKCPDEPEDFDGFEDEDGCPEPDNDGDGILDVDDQCPNVKGISGNGGCP